MNIASCCSSAGSGTVRKMLQDVAEKFGNSRFYSEIATPIPGPEFCITVGRIFDQAADAYEDPEVAGSYRAFKTETAAQFDALVTAGLAVRPWLPHGQPYRSSAELRQRAAAAGELFVYLTRYGHGGRSKPAKAHPMREPSPVIIDGETFLYNDLFRAVHDAFGHILAPNNFSLQGELRAGLTHMRMYSERAAKAVFTETVGQISWFYCGPHLLTEDGSRCRTSGEAGYVPPESRPYADQRVFLFPDRLIREFLMLCECEHPAAA